MYNLLENDSDDYLEDYEQTNITKKEPHIEHIYIDFFRTASTSKADVFILKEELIQPTSQR
jgi:hypothetical protein